MVFWRLCLKVKILHANCIEHVPVIQIENDVLNPLYYNRELYQLDDEDPFNYNAQAWVIRVGERA